MLQFILGLLTLILLSVIFYFTCKFFKKYEKKNIVFELLVTVIIVQFFKWAFIDITRVPSSSMEKTLIPGDFVLISKLHYGVRTPSTLLQIPLTHQTTKFFEFKSYLDWIQIPFFRFPGFTKIKTNDVVVFNTPSQREIPMDVRLFYVKRCIGLPGQRIKMENGKYYVNDKIVEDAPNKTYEFILLSTEKLSRKWMYKYNIYEYELIRDDEDRIFYLIKILSKYDIEKTINKIKEDPNIINVELESQKPIEDMFVKLFEGYYDTANWGGKNGILIPKRGLEIELTEENIKRYWRYIKDECGKSIEKKGDSEIYFKGEKIQKYKFKYDYYMMIGDNIYNSNDSRYWGLVREDEIYAKPLLTIFSKSQDSLLGGFKLRLFKGMWY